MSAEEGSVRKRAEAAHHGLPTRRAICPRHFLPGETGSKTRAPGHLSPAAEELIRK